MPIVDLPTLRSDLVIKDNGYDDRGAPSWMLYDQVRNRFFLLGFLEHELLIRWSLGNTEQLLHSINSETSLNLSEQDIQHFIYFLRGNFLCNEEFLYIKEMATIRMPYEQKSLWKWLIKNYLFFRIPLVHPNKFLSKTSIIGNFLFSRTLFFIMLFLLMLDYYYISPRWDEFTHTYSQVFTWQGIFILWFSIIFCKFFHEFGHAYMCKHYNLNVPTMGLVFIIFWPLLYTDTTESWHLSHKKRLWIVSAGIWMETYSAILAGIIWAFSSNLTIQAVAFSMIAVSWLLSVVINVSPFFRFDGYYFLSDLLNIPNLQPRAFAIAQWWIRWVIFGLDTPHESLPASKRHFFIIYAIGTMLYRLIVFFGIALLVYHYFFKTLGIILFLIEIVFFIAAPILYEIKTWWYLRENMTINKHTITSLCVLVFLLVIFFFPVKTTIYLPGIIQNMNQSVFSPDGSYVEKVYVEKGATVHKDQIIIQLISDDLLFKQTTAKLEIEKIYSELRASANNSKYLTQRNVYLSELTKSKSNYSNYTTQIERLAIRSKFDGILTDIDPYLKKGMYINKGRWLAEIIDPSIIEVEGFVTEDDLDKLHAGQVGVFYSEQPFALRIPVKVLQIEKSNIKNLAPHNTKDDDLSNRDDYRIESFTYLVGDYGGSIPVNEGENKKISPIKSTYRVNLTLKNPMIISHVVRGNMLIYTKAHSLFYYSLRFLKQLWIKEANL